MISWNPCDVVASQVNCDKEAVGNVIKLLEEGNTVPFIARYRTHKTGSLEPEKLREIKTKFEEVSEVKEKAMKAVKKLKSMGSYDRNLEASILNATDLCILEDLTSVLKPKPVPDALKKAMQLNLKGVASELLETGNVNVVSLIDPACPELSSLKKVEENLVLVVAHVVVEKPNVVDRVVQKCRERGMAFVVSKKKKAKKDVKISDVVKFKDHADCRIPITTIQPSKYLAMRRGEKVNVLKTSIEFDDSVKRDFTSYCERTFVKRYRDETHRSVLLAGFEHAYIKLISPRVATILRAELRKSSDSASISAFQSNLKQILMAKPVRNRCILGVDPGISHGCKLALIGPTGDVLDTDVIYLSINQRSGATERVGRMLCDNRCDLVAIGDGTGCREAAEFFSQCIRQGTFRPLDVTFCIVQECGSSVYSASKLGAKDLPDIQVLHRGAVSIARRLQDPLAEMVKMDPKCMGVGMYQHDLSDTKLKTSVNEVVEECVSFVGVDINACSAITLQHVSGIGPSLAKKIIEARSKNGGFKNRDQLLEIPGLGSKTFTQCAGFLRVYSAPAPVVEEYEKVGNSNKRKIANENDLPKTKRRKKMCAGSDANFLDSTSVHPESYDKAEMLLVKAKLQPQDIGQEAFAEELQEFVLKSDMKALWEEVGSNEVELNQIVESLKQLIYGDIRNDHDEPFFQSEVREMKDLRLNQELTGSVSNVVDFGAFVNIGVKNQALIHRSEFNGFKLYIGNHVRVRVIKVDLMSCRVSLSLISVCSRRLN